MPFLSRKRESEHSVVSVEHFIGNTLSLRVEAYHKSFDHLRQRFENLFERVSLLPELLPDRVVLEPTRARARGIELSLQADAEPWRWWLSHSRNFAADELSGVWVRRSWEEPWSSKGGFIWSGARWTASAALTLHKGWPISPLELVDSDLVVSRHNSEAFESFRSLDVRISRTVALARGSIELLFEMNNALDFDNECCFGYSVITNNTGEIVGLTKDIDNWLQNVPTLGFLWSFGSSR